MKPIILIATALALMLSGCGRGGNGNGDGLPENFDKMSDNQRVAALMKIISPDSLAHLLVDASLGRMEGVRIDTLAMATLYAYEQYHGEDLNKFSQEFDDYCQSQSLADKMRLYAMTGKVDPQQMGFQLGLEYVGYIRDHKVSEKEIDAEIAAFKKACTSDPETYKRFLTGFKTVLEADKGKDLPPNIYRKYINLK